MTDEATINVEVSDQDEQTTAPEVTEAAETEQETPTGGETDSGVEEDNGEEAGEESEQQDGDEQGDDGVPYGVKKKLGKLTARVKERDEKLAEKENQLKELQSRVEFLQKQAQPAPPAVQETPKPTLEGCNFDVSAYEQQMAAWSENQTKVQLAKATFEREIAERQKSYDVRVAEYMKEKPDWADSVQHVPASLAMADTIHDMEQGPAVAYYLSKHLNEAIDIARMPPHRAAYALAKIEANLKTQTPAKPVTNAPAPIKPLNTTAPVKKNLADLPMSEYVKERAKQRRNSSGFL